MNRTQPVTCYNLTDVQAILSILARQVQPQNQAFEPNKLGSK
jgi:hypothetical protein